MNGRMDMAFHEKKTPAGGAVDARRTAEIKSRMRDEKLTCAAAMAAAETLGAGPLDVGRAADALGLRLTVCQLGLFGFPGGAKGWTGAKAADLPVPPGFEEAVLAAGTAAGKIACQAANTGHMVFSTVHANDTISALYRLVERPGMDFAKRLVGKHNAKGQGAGA